MKGIKITFKLKVAQIIKIRIERSLCRPYCFTYRRIHQIYYREHVDLPAYAMNEVAQLTNLQPSPHGP